MSSGRWLRRIEWGLLGVGVVAYAELPRTIDGDAGVRYATLASLLEQGRLSNTMYSIVQQLVTVPLYLLGKLAGSPFQFVTYFNMLVFFGGLAALFALLRNRLDADVLRRFLLLLTAASMFPRHVENYYGEVLTGVVVAVGLLLFETDRSVAGTAAVVVGVVNTPAALGGLAVVAARNAWRSRQWAKWATPVCAAAALILLESWARRGSPLRTGYEGNAGFPTILPYSGRPGFSYPWALGVLSQWLSFGKGILFFAPGLLLALVPRDSFPDPVERFYRASILFLWGLILVYAKWWAWYGGWFWGPRFLLFAAFPSSLLLALHLSRRTDRRTVRVLTLALLLLSVWVAASGAVFGETGVEICRQNHYALEAYCWYVPEFSPLVHPFISHPVLNLHQWLLLAYFAAVGICLAVPVLVDVAAVGRRHATMRVSR